jgi:hypothetical protein
MTFPDWVWLYFGAFGTAGAVLFTLVVWSWLKVHTRAGGPLRSAAKWNMIGLMFLFLAAWFACGIGGPPANLLSRDASTHNVEIGYLTAMLSIFLSVPGWACMLVGMRKMAQGARSG